MGVGRGPGGGGLNYGVLFCPYWRQMSSFESFKKSSCAFGGQNARKSRLIIVIITRISQLNVCKQTEIWKLTRYWPDMRTSYNLWPGHNSNLHHGKNCSDCKHISVLHLSPQLPQSSRALWEVTPDWLCLAGGPGAKVLAFLAACVQFRHLMNEHWVQIWKNPRFYVQAGRLGLNCSALEVHGLPPFRPRCISGKRLT